MPSDRCSLPVMVSFYTFRRRLYINFSSFLINLFQSRSVFAVDEYQGLLIMQNSEGRI
jgi:hypothetical protein